MRLIWKIVLPVLIVAAATAIAIVLIRNRPAPQRAPVVVAAPSVTVATVMPQERRIDVRTHGTVQPRATSVLGAEVAGRVVWVRPDLAEGVLVATGDELLRIDDADYRALLADAEAALALRRQELVQERAEGERAAREWAELGQGEPGDLVLRRPQLVAAQARIAAAEAAVAKATRDLERTVVRAPYTARITHKVVDLGSRVAPGSELLTLQAASHEVVLPLALEQVRFVDLPLAGQVLSDGPAVTLSARIGAQRATWQARIVRTLAGLDERTRMVHAVAALLPSGDDPPMLSGLFVEAAIAGRPVAGVVELPLAVLQTGDAIYVYRPGEGGEGTAVRRRIEILDRGPEHVLVRGDLQAGDRVVAVRVAGMRDGMPLRLDRGPAPETGKAVP
jgi:RND family efflux transporter MFP subunit